ncbi:MAG: hypothetical protein K8S23_02390 [Candidatus Cloacimonetes bacterium]|nr:hypothetical protein [Candidatus Cloacimonadota bacterium]
MKNIFLIFFCCLIFNLVSETAPNLSSRIEIDGYSDEFINDEVMLVDSLGNTLESDNDSYWGEHNDIKQIKITWDQDFLYLAVDACSWDNNVILFIDIYDDYGIEDMTSLNAWARKFYFFNFNPDFFLATWDKNENPQFWKMTEGSSSIAEQVPEITTKATYDSGQLGRSMEAKIPWETLYYVGSAWNRTLENYPSIKIAALITTGEDFTGGPDVAPDNLGDMSEDSGKMLDIDNYLEFIIDEDGDGNPDIGISPNSWNRISYFAIPQTFIPKNISMGKITFPNGKVLNPYDLTSPFEVQISPNRDSIFNAIVYNIKGKEIKNLPKCSNENCKWFWDGKDKNGKIVPFGFYLVQVASGNKENSKIEAFSVIK